MKGNLIFDRTKYDPNDYNQAYAPDLVDALRMKEIYDRRYAVKAFDDEGFYWVQLVNTTSAKYMMSITTKRVIMMHQETATDALNEAILDLASSAEVETVYDTYTALLEGVTNHGKVKGAKLDQLNRVKSKINPKV